MLTFINNITAYVLVFALFVCCLFPRLHFQQNICICTFRWVLFGICTWQKRPRDKTKFYINSLYHIDRYISRIKYWESNIYLLRCLFSYLSIDVLLYIVSGSFLSHLMIKLQLTLHCNIFKSLGYSFLVLMIGKHFLDALYIHYV